MDIFSALHEDIFNEVVSYLSAKDIRKGTLVCKSWYQMFGQSNKCLQKLTIRYSDYNCKNDLNALLKSDRKYQNLIIEFQNSCIQELRVEANIRAIIKKFSKSIVKLETPQDFRRICKLPKLKELKCKTSNWDFYKRESTIYFYSNGLFASCINLTKLEVRCDQIDDRYIKILQKAIKNMQNLKSLALQHLAVLKNIGTEDCHFRLERFKSSSIHMSDISDFLKCHQSTLKVINASLYPEDFPFIFLQCPKLHTLRVYFYFPRDQKLEIPENSTIKNLHISGSFYDQEIQDKIAEILTKLKNLQHIRLEMLYARYIPSLLACKTLTSVAYQRFNYDVTEDQKNALNINENIRFIEKPFMH